MAVSIRRLVDPPAFTPNMFGLLSVAEMDPDTETDPHWRNGVEFQPQFCGTALTTATVCVTGGTSKPAVADGLVTRGATAFAVHAWLNCSPVGYTADDWRRLTVAALVNNENAAVEQVFTTGVVPGDTVYPHLAANAAVNDFTGGGQVVNLQTAATVVVTGGGVDIVEGVGLLEEAMGGCYGGTATLHVPRRALSNMAAWGLVVREGNRLRTPGGSLVAAGTGYTGAAPDGSALAPGVRWLYATGAVKAWRSTVELTGVNPADWIGRARNDQVLIAERTYVIGWDCCHFAVPVQFGGDVSGAVGTPS